MFVEKWMTPQPTTFLPQTTISAAALAMGRHKFRHLLVAEPSSSGKNCSASCRNMILPAPFPTITTHFHSKSLKKRSANRFPRSWFATSSPWSPTARFEEAAHILRTRRINALPVVRSGYLVGIITESDIFDAFVGIIGPNSHGTKVILESDSVKNALVVMAQLADRHNLQILNALSFHDEKSNNKATSVFHFTGKPAASFPQDLGKAGFRVLKIA
jgi:acetoin utilization protein AcuB